MKILQHLWSFDHFHGIFQSSLPFDEFYFAIGTLPQSMQDTVTIDKFDFFPTRLECTFAFDGRRMFNLQSLGRLGFVVRTHSFC